MGKMKKNGVGWDLLFVYLRHVGLLLLAIFLGYKLYRLAPWRQSSPFFSETMDTAHRASAESDFVYNQMYQLAMSYFKPEWLTDGINKTHFESLAAAAIIPHTSRNATVIVQVINSTIWVDRTGWNTPFSWDHMRAHFILGLLQQLLTKAVLPDFEFILVVPLVYDVIPRYILSFCVEYS